MERKHQHILNVVKAITFHSTVPLNLWNFSIQHDVHLMNKIPSPLLQSKCPYEILFKEFPVLIHLKIFGCLCYATTIQARRTKFSPRAQKSIFLGFQDGTKGYILDDLTSHDLFVSRNVIFYETFLPFKSTNLISPKFIPEPVDIHQSLDDVTPHGPIIPTVFTISAPNPNFSVPVGPNLFLNLKTLVH